MVNLFLYNLKGGFCKKNVAFFLLFLISTVSAFAAHEKGSSRLIFSSYNSATNSGLYLQDNKYNVISANLTTTSSIGFFDQSYKNKLVLGIDRTILSLGSINSQLSNNVYRAEVDVTVIYNSITPSGGVLVSTFYSVVKTLTVSFSGFNVPTNSSAPATEIDLDAFNYEYGYQSLVSISAIRIYNSAGSTTPLVTTNVPNNLYIELQSDAERYYNLSSVGVSPLVNSTDLTITSLSASNELEIKWLRMAGAETYDLEWLWLDEFTYGGTINGTTLPVNAYWSAAPEISFRNNSTRIRTDQNTYRLSNIYESGYLFFRVRGVGRCQTPISLSGMANPTITDYYTGWTWPDTSIISVQPSGYGVSGGSTAPWYVSVSGSAHEQDKNWVYTGVYAEGGKKKEVVSYFDGAQYSRQTVTRNNSENVAVVAETYYDYVGRPTIQALPTPVADATIKFYQQAQGSEVGFNFKAGTSIAFTKKAFSEASTANACAAAPAGFDNGYGTGKYYSSSNPFISSTYNAGYTPSGETYPFTQTEYLPDNTGRIARQGGLGSALKIETSGAAKRDTRYLYGTVEQDELDRLFGSEAGNATHYSKKTVIDANGGISVTYMNQEGKVVATAVSGSSPGNTDALKNSAGTALATTGAQVETDLLNKNAPGDYDTPNDKNLLQGDALVFTEKLTVDGPKTYYFNYTLLGNSCYQATTSICYDCVYDLEFDIKDNCGNRPIGFTPVTYALGTISGSYPSFVSNPTLGINATGGDNPVNFSFQQILPSATNSLAVSLDEGMYTIMKRLTVNKQALDFYLKHYLANVVKPASAFDADESLNMDVSGCGMDCKDCATKLGGQSTFTLALITADPNLTQAQANQKYTEAVKACYEPCQQDDNCSSTIEVMLSDLTPGGQYAEFSGSGLTSSGDTYPLSVFNRASSLRRQIDPLFAPWRFPRNFYNSAQNYYLDENGQPSTVIITKLSSSPDIYDPPLYNLTFVLIPSYQPTLVAGTTDQYYTYPHLLQNVSDFVSAFQPSWANSLLRYHPEYPYVKWCIKNRAMKVSPITVYSKNFNVNGLYMNDSTAALIDNSVGFDSLYAAIDDIDDMGKSSYSVLFNPLAYDPYWTTTGKYYVSANGSSPALPDPTAAEDTLGSISQRLSSTSASPADFTGTNLYFNQRTNKSANSRFLNYKGTGYSLIQVAAFLATPLSGQAGQAMATQMAKLQLNAGGNYPSASFYPSNVTGVNPNFNDPMDPRWILALTKQNVSSATADDSYKRKAWDNFKSLYASLKQEMQSEAVQSYVMNSNNRGTNECIGKADFDMNAVKYTTYSSDATAVLISTNSPPVTSFPINQSSFTTLVNTISGLQSKDWFKYSSSYSRNWTQECGLSFKDLYKGKIKRYNLVESSDVDPSAVANVGAGIYQETGLCPNAYDLQTFLNGMTQQSSGFFSTSLDLSNTVPGFSQNLYAAILPIVPTPFVSAFYNYSSGSSTSSNLVANLSINAVSCSFNLTMPSTVPGSYPAGINSWSSYSGSTPVYTLTQFSALFPSSGSTFTVMATASQSNLNAPPTNYTLVLTGGACFQLTGCSFVPPCKANGMGKAVSALLNTFSYNSVFPAPYSGSAYQVGNLLSPVISPYAYVFTNSFKPILETPGVTPGTWSWSYTPSGNQIEIYDGTTTNKRLQIKLAMPPGSPNISCLQSFKNFRPDPASSTGRFLLDGFISGVANIGPCPNGTFAISGTVSIGAYSGSWVYTALNIGGCSFNSNSCNTQEHLVKNDLEAWVTSSNAEFSTMLSSSAQNISNIILFTPLLRSYLNSSESINSNGPQQNYAWWFKDVNASNSYQVTGWLMDTTVNTAPTFLPWNGCKIVVKKVNPSGTVISSLLSGNLGSLFKLESGPYQNNNIYSFKILPTSNPQDTLLVTTSCFPLRACESCTGNIVVPSTYYTPTLIQNFTNTASYTLMRGTSNYLNLGTGTQLAALPSPQNTIHDLEYVRLMAGTFSNFWKINTVMCPNTTLNSSFWSYGPPNNSVNAILLNAVGCGNNPETVSSKYTQFFSVATSTVYSISFGLTSVGYANNQSLAGTDYVIRVFDNNNNLIYVCTKAEIFHVSQWSGAGVESKPLYLTAGLTYKLEIEYINLLSNNTVIMSNIYLSQPSILGGTYPCVNTTTKWPTDTMPTTDYMDPCADFLQNITDNTSDEKFDANIDSLKSSFIRKYIKNCLGRAKETLTMKYNRNEYHYTLYYYDQVGNLARTVPPEGVKVIDLNAVFSGGTKTNREVIKDDRANYLLPTPPAKQLYTTHKFLTTYNYNSLNQLIRQETPDAGVSSFYYDNLGRLVASQNAEQLNQSTSSTNYIYSYTKYDALGRIVMVGKLGTNAFTGTAWLPSGQTLKDVLSNTTYPFNLTIASGSHKEVTQTYYGDDIGGGSLINGLIFNTGSQDNLRNRVASVSIEDVYDGVSSTYNHATHYSYDIHGNVKELIQDNTDLRDYAATVQWLKHIEYTYDLISGNVNTVTYQRSRPDMMAHQYLYDASNRITNVYTSRDGMLWDQDAKYYYYLHGPLARVETGEYKVQGSDYAYTLQGWLKGVNSEGLKADNDMGKDGYNTLASTSTSNVLNRFNARDAYGYALNYFTDPFVNITNDYTPINGSQATPSTYFLASLSSNSGTMPALYNGNISHMSASYLSLNPTSISLNSLNTPTTVTKYTPYSFLKAYKYDQLNRITAARALAEAVNSSNAWNYTSSGALANEYSENFTYDENGNIMKADRALSSTGKYDDMTYYYYDASGVAFNPATAGAGVVPTNKLAYVTDASSSTLLADDIDNQSANNYSYDKIGNLTADAAESISSITWNAYGKIKSITRTGGSTKPNLEFKYDATGNRVSKKVVLSSSHYVVTYYVRDATGNVMSTYERDFAGTAVANATQILRVKELDLYGSKRLGLYSSNDMLGYIVNGSESYNSTIPIVPERRRILGLKSYELSNHLGNVLTVISDRKLGLAITNTNTADYFVPDLLTTTDYYAFGAPMPGRQFNNGNYRYGFNGKENDNEIKGTGNSLDLGARILDSRLGKFLTIDPRFKEFGWQSPYAYFGNNPISQIDLNGEGPDDPPKKTQQRPTLPTSKFKSLQNLPNIDPKKMFTANVSFKAKVGSFSMGIKIAGAQAKFNVDAASFGAIVNSKPEMEGSVDIGQVGLKISYPEVGEYGIGVGVGNAKFNTNSGLSADIGTYKAKLEVASKTSVEVKGVLVSSSNSKPTTLTYGQSNASYSDRNIGAEFSISAIKVSVEANMQEIGKVVSSLGSMIGELLFKKEVEEYQTLKNGPKK